MTASSPTFSILVRGRHPDFVDLPWDVPLAEWDHPRLVRMAHGISRHVVRFVRYDERVYAVKATGRVAAEKEYRTLRMLAEDHLPSVEAVGVVTIHREPGERPAARDGPDREWGGAGDDDGVLITRYLDFSLPYWYLLGRDEGPDITQRLIDAAAVLLVRLHLAGVYWGDCSLSNVLFRRDAGAMMAYLVDAETSEKRPSISDGLRQRELDIAWENIVGGLLDLQAAGRVPETVDPVEIADTLRDRYDMLWTELTRAEEFQQTERWHIDQRLRQLNELGFDVEELTIDPSVTGSNLRIRPVLVEEGHHSRELQRRTGLRVQENQARRLLADIANFRARRQQDTGEELADGMAAALWMAEVFEPIVNAVPDELWTRLEAPELFHQLLEHRYLMSEREQREVSNPEALADYLAHVLPHRPAERNLSDGSL
jgi:hypothetical protein